VTDAVGATNIIRAATFAMRAAVHRPVRCPGCLASATMRSSDANTLAAMARAPMRSAPPPGGK